MAKWARGQSGNRLGRPRKGRSISDILERKMDKEAFAQRLLDLAMGVDPATPPLVSMGACRTVLAYVQGLPRQQDEGDREPLRVVIEYIDEGPYPVIDVHSQVRQIAGGDD